MRQARRPLERGTHGKAQQQDLDRHRRRQHRGCWDAQPLGCATCTRRQGGRAPSRRGTCQGRPGSDQYAQRRRRKLPDGRRTQGHAHSFLSRRRTRTRPSRRGPRVDCTRAVGRSPATLPTPDGRALRRAREIHQAAQPAAVQARAAGAGPGRQGAEAGRSGPGLQGTGTEARRRHRRGEEVHVSARGLHHQDGGRTAQGGAERVRDVHRERPFRQAGRVSGRAWLHAARGRVNRASRPAAEGEGPRGARPRRAEVRRAEEGLANPDAARNPAHPARRPLCPRLRHRAARLAVLARCAGSLSSSARTPYPRSSSGLSRGSSSPQAPVPAAGWMAGTSPAMTKTVSVLGCYLSTCFPGRRAKARRSGFFPRRCQPRAGKIPALAPLGRERKTMGLEPPSRAESPRSSSGLSRGSSSPQAPVPAEGWMAGTSPAMTMREDPHGG